MNLTIISGHLTANPELRQLNSGHQVVNGTIAHNRPYTTKDGEKREETTFLAFSAWGPVAKHITDHVSTKRRIQLIGSLRTESWEKDGQKHSRTVLRADTFEFMDSKPRDLRDESEGAGARTEEAVPVAAPVGAVSAPVGSRPDDEPPF